MNISKKSSLENSGSVAPGLILNSYLILSGSLEANNKETREAQDFCTVLLRLQNLVVLFWGQNNFLTHAAAGESFDIRNMRLCFLTWEKLGDLWPRMQWKVTCKEACTHREPTPPPTKSAPPPPDTFHLAAAPPVGSSLWACYKTTQMIAFRCSLDPPTLTHDMDWLRSMAVPLLE